MAKAKTLKNSEGYVYPVTKAEITYLSDNTTTVEQAIKDIVVRGAGAPTASTVGKIGTIYENSTNGKLYKCTSISGGTYTWEEITGGGGSTDIYFDTNPPIMSIEDEIERWGTITYTENNAQKEYLIQSEEDFNQLGMNVEDFPTSVTFSDGKTILLSAITGFEFGNHFPTVIPNGFLAFCTSLNSPISIPSGVTSIGNYFLAYCITFNQQVTIPDSVTTIGYLFMYSCAAYNKPLTIPSSVVNTGKHESEGPYGWDFMIDCQSFTGPLTINSTSTRLWYESQPDGSFACFVNASSPNCPALTTGVSIQGPGAEEAEKKLANMCELDGLGTLAFRNLRGQNWGKLYHATSEFPYFIKSQEDFNVLCNNSTSAVTILTFSDGTTIGKASILGFSFGANVPTSINNYFLYSCVQLRGSLILPSTVTSVGSYFIGRGTNFIGPLCLNTTAHPTDNNSLSTPSNSAATYTTGITLVGTGASTWKSALADRTTSPYRKLIKV